MREILLETTKLFLFTKETEAAALPVLQNKCSYIFRNFHRKTSGTAVFL